MKCCTSLLLLLISLSACAQRHDENIHKSFKLPGAISQAKVVVANITGHIEVEGHEGQDVQLELRKTLDAKSDKQLAEAKEEVSLGVIEENNVLYLYMKTPCSSNQPLHFGDNGQVWVRSGWNNCQWRPQYYYKFDFVLKVPKAIKIQLSTINDGDIVVKNVVGPIDVNNINGAIKLENIAGATKAHTINGDLDVTYTNNPSSASSYYTLNGDINAYYKKGLDAQLSFKSFNGEFFTNLPELSVLPTKVKKEESRKGKGINYKIGGESAMQVRDGTVPLDFETFNGNVYVREN
ncbi:MAG: hypothetical protein AAGG75_26105 [Bacteroidota bacterium]